MQEKYPGYVSKIASWNLSDAWRRNRTTTTTRAAILLIFTNTS